MIPNRLPKTHRQAAVFLLSVILPAASLSATVSYETRYLAGDPAPGTSSTFGNMYRPIIDEAGRIAFNSYVQDGRRGVWSEGSGSLQLVAIEDMTPPGINGEYHYFDKNSYKVNRDGQLTFHGLMKSGVGDVTHRDNSTIWLYDAGALSMVVREGDAVPGTPGEFFGEVFASTISGSNQHFISANLTTITGGVATSNGYGYWLVDAGSWQMIHRDGETAPGTSGGTFMTSNSMKYDQSGQVVYGGNLVKGTGDVTAANNVGIWSYESGATSLIYRKGDTAPGTGGGTFGGRIGNNLQVNASGDIAFAGNLHAGTGGVTRRNRFGIWRENSGSLELAVRSGDRAIGTIRSVYFNGFENLVFNNAGQVAFTSRLKGRRVSNSNDESIWFEDHGDLNLLAREGSRAPGTRSRFKSFLLSASWPSLNSAGEVVFRARLVNGKEGIWATNADGELELIVLEGRMFDVDNDPDTEDLRKILDVHMSHNHRGSSEYSTTAINDAGQIAFQLSLTGATGVFVASLDNAIAADGFVGLSDQNVAGVNGGASVTHGYQAAVSSTLTSQPDHNLPEPATIALFGLGLGLIGRTRVRSNVACV